tara:strand:+ start:196 stop:1332 length:1137 start_codon:yes stop_codon:yes gene_type:complete
LDRLLLVTTVDATFKYILKDQPTFLKKKYSVTVCSSDLTGIKDFAEAEDVNYFSVPMKREISPFYDLYSIFCLIKEIKSLRPKIIHSFTPKAGLICALSGFLCRVPVRIHTFTGLIFPYRSGLLKMILVLVDRVICALDTHIIAEGRGVRSQLKNKKITEKEIQIIGNGNIAGVDIQFYNRDQVRQNSEIIKLKKDLMINQESMTFIFAGRINEEKGIIELLSAINNSYDKNINLIIVGSFESNNFESKVRNMTSNSKNKIDLVNWKNDIRPYLSISDCFVLPSYREGFPNVLLQAGAMNLPAIVTNVPGSNEIITHGYNGWICNSKSSLELYDMINLVASLTTSKINEVGNNARKNVEKKYEKTKYQEKLIEFYNQL